MNASNQELLIKTGIWCTKEIIGNSINDSIEKKDDFLKQLTKSTNLSFNFNMKTNLNKISELLKFFKLILAKANSDPVFEAPLIVLDEFHKIKNMHRKLKELFSLFFDENVLNYYQIKKLIWAVFILMRCKLIERSYNILECLNLLVISIIIIVVDIPNEYFPLRLNITKENKAKVIESEISAKLKTVIQKDYYEKINNELRVLIYDEENHKLPLEKQIEVLFSCYQTYLKKGMFDDRILMCDSLKNISSPIRQPSTVNIKVPFSCAKQLIFSNSSTLSPMIHPKSNSAEPRIASTPIDMTPCTRAVNLRNWTHTYIANFAYQSFLNTQARHVPKYSFNTNLLNLYQYIGNLCKELDSLLNKHNARIITQLDNMIILCLKLMSLLIQKEETLFTEEFRYMALYNEDFVKAIVVITFEIILFIEDIEEISFYKIPEVFGLAMYDLWKALNPLQINIITFPQEIKRHLEELEYQLLTYLIWKNPSQKFITSMKLFFNENIPKEEKEKVEKLGDFEFKNQSLFLFHNKDDFELEFENKKTTALNSYRDIQPFVSSYRYLNSMAIFFRRVINYSNLLNKTIFDHLGLSSNIAIQCENLFKKILTSENYISIIYDKHIDQIVICVIIAILTNNNLFSASIHQLEDLSMQISLGRIQDSYKKSKPNQSNFFSMLLFNKVKVSNCQYQSICDYYKIFINNLQDVLIQMKEENDESFVETIYYPNKKRKLSFSIGEKAKNNCNKEMLTRKSAFSQRIENYLPFQKKMQNADIRSGFFSSLIIENKTKRHERLKDLSCELIKIESNYHTANNFNNPLFNKLKFGLDSDKSNI